MKIILVITVLEMLVVALCLLVRPSRNRHLEIASGRLNRPLSHGDSPIINLPPPDLPDVFDTNRWAFLNAWQVNPQADDRRPMCGGVTEGAGPPSVRRSVSRRSHQLMFKEWSKNRSASGTG